MACWSGASSSVGELGSISFRSPNGSHTATQCVLHLSVSMCSGGRAFRTHRRPIVRRGHICWRGSKARGDFCEGPGRASPCHFGLYLVELITVNNGIVVVFNEVHGKLTCVLDGLAADEILTEGLLHQDIAAVFFILQDTADAGDGPFRRVR